ncbi:HD-GYP domain-containing protein [Thauera phenolivorans]|uniref:HD-GYP domain-containing protein n=1 Tax=Thauera phenolivorans TaxID=1792543 RepID=UPI0009F70B04|nr:HD-GYP domain-containing protein [Thauera phenolivorans]
MNNHDLPELTEILLTDKDVPPCTTDCGATPSPAACEAAFRQMYRMVDDLHTLRSEREAAFRALEKAHRQALMSLARAAEFKDEDTWVHILRIGAMSARLAAALGHPPAWCEMILFAAPMHDVGKIGIPDHILRKPGDLDEAERAIINTHPELGARILGDADVPLLGMAREIALAHHECWDGSGYPHGLAGEGIPLAARIVAVVDYFDALTMDRCYRKAYSDEDAIAMLRAQRGGSFDPQIVDAALSIIDRLIALRDLVNATAPERMEEWGEGWWRN